MTKMWRKKGEILKLIEKKPMTVSGISERLGLAVSTTSQHVAELKEIGAITEMDIGHAKKWRYYKLNPGFDAGEMIGQGNDRGIFSKRVVTAGGAFAAVAIAAIVLIMLAHGQSGGSALLFSLTDPPTVPSGTTALIINYSSLETHVLLGNSSEWIAGNGSGTTNLLNLINSSQIIGLTDIPSKGVADQVRFNINSARITINGTTYNVSIPDSQVSADIYPPASLQGTGQVLIDLFPTVSAVYGNNSTSFVLLLSVKAITHQQGGQQPRGMITGLGQDEIHDFDAIPQGISFMNATVTQVNGSSIVSVDVVNRLNATVLVRHVILLGSMNMTLRGNYSDGNGHAGRWGAMNMTPHVVGYPGGRGGLWGAMPHQTAAGGAGQQYLRIDADRVGAPHMLDFIVDSNGTMQVQDQFMQEYNSGYILAAGQSATFTFTGNITLANGAAGVAFAPGADYKVIVMGEQNVYASDNVVIGS